MERLSFARVLFNPRIMYQVGSTWTNTILSDLVNIFLHFLVFLDIFSGISSEIETHVIFQPIFS